MQLLHDLLLLCHLASSISLYIDFQMLPMTSSCIEIYFKSICELFRMRLTYPQIRFTFVYTTFSKTQCENQEICGTATSCSKLLHDLPSFCHLDLYLSLCTHVQRVSPAHIHIGTYLKFVCVFFMSFTNYLRIKFAIVCHTSPETEPKSQKDFKHQFQHVSDI